MKPQKSRHLKKVAAESADNIGLAGAFGIGVVEIVGHLVFAHGLLTTWGKGETEMIAITIGGSIPQ
jgi:hypothetical protein